MKFVYFGSFRVSADILEGMVHGGDGALPLMPAVVVCSPDRPAGRKKILTAPAIKQRIAKEGWGIQVLQPEKVMDIIPELKKINADVFVVMGYPQILPPEILSIPRLGTLGIHPSLLPKYRGASPIQSALLENEAETGVTLYQMDEKVDHGPILAANTLSIDEDETNTGLEKKLASLAAELLVKILPEFVAGKIKPHEQAHATATLTKKFTTIQAQVDMQKDSPNTIYNKIRAFTPEPGVWTMNFPGYEGKRVKLLAAHFENSRLTVTEIQPDGKKPMKV